MPDAAKVLYSNEDIRRRVAELGREITADYAGKSPVLISLLKGSTVFLADLFREIRLPVRIDFMAISPYGEASGGARVVRIVKDLDQDIGGEDVVIVEDIVDTGLTLSYLLSTLRSRHPRSVEICALLDRSTVRITPLDVRYRGFDCPESFVVGYGLDADERWRNLRGILTLRTPRRSLPIPASFARSWNGMGRKALRLPVRKAVARLAGAAMIEMNLVGVRVELPTNQPIVLLKEKEGERFLPIWIGAMEATAIAFALQGIVTARPMTHDLLKNLLEELGVSIDRIVITELRDGTFYAVIQMQQNGSSFEVSSRPSDAIALAVRVNVPVFANEDVLTEASIVIRDDEEQEVEKFREFLEQVNPEDFA